MSTDALHGNTASDALELQFGNGRLQVVTTRDLESGCLVETCCARKVARWQACADFVWSCGAFTVPCGGSVQDVDTRISDAAEHAILPFGWGMLYAEACALDLEANVTWQVLTTEAGDEVDSNGQLCWLTLSTTRHVSAGEELRVDRGWPPSSAEEEVEALDVATLAISQLDADHLHRRLEVPVEKGFDNKHVEQDLHGAICLRVPSSLTHAAAGPVQMGASERHGVGIFGRRAIRCGEVVEITPVVVVEDGEIPGYGGTFANMSHAFADYAYEARLVKRQLCCVALGYGALYNHAEQPNIEQQWAFAEDKSSADALSRALTFSYAFVALRDIAEGEELLHHYGDEYWKARGVVPT